MNLISVKIKVDLLAIKLRCEIMSHNTTCIPADPTTCPPGPPVSPEFSATAEIIMVLCPAKCYGLTTNTLLSRLQSRYPDANWTEELLQENLEQGMTRGLYTYGCPTTQGEPRVALSKDGIRRHPQNAQFSGLCYWVKPTECRLGTQTSNYNAVYAGNETCCRP